MYAIPQPASIETRLLEAQVFAKMFLDEIKEEGLEKRTKRFLEEYRSSADDYRPRLSIHFNGSVPDEVHGILFAIGERLSLLQEQSENSCLTPVFTATKMASTMAEIRSLTHILSE